MNERSIIRGTFKPGQSADASLMGNLEAQGFYITDTETADDLADRYEGLTAYPLPTVTPMEATPGQTTELLLGFDDCLFVIQVDTYPDDLLPRYMGAFNAQALIERLGYKEVKPGPNISRILEVLATEALGTWNPQTQAWESLDTGPPPPIDTIKVACTATVQMAIHEIHGAHEPTSGAFGVDATAVDLTVDMDEITEAVTEHYRNAILNGDIA